MDEQILILGLGSEILKDDSIPLRLVDELSKRNLDKSYVFKKANVVGIELLDYITGYNTLFILDTLKSLDAAGTVKVYDNHCFDKSNHIGLHHNVSLEIVLKLGKKLNLKIPEKFYIIVIGIEEDREFDSELSCLLSFSFEQILRDCVDILINPTQQKIYEELKINE